MGTQELSRFYFHKCILRIYSIGKNCTLYLVKAKGYGYAESENLENKNQDSNRRFATK